MAVLLVVGVPFLRFLVLFCFALFGVGIFRCYRGKYEIDFLCL